MIKVGDKAPDFTLQSVNGRVTLSDFKGKKVILYFYPKDNTPGCTLEACGFSEHLKEFEKLNAVIIGVSKDSCESHDKFIKGQDLKIILLSDNEHRVQEKYGVWRLKNFMGKKFVGTVRCTFIIDEQGKVVKIFDPVKVIGHVEDVLETIKSIK